MSHFEIKMAKLAGWFVLTVGLSSVLQAQDLAPRAYVITPQHSNAIILVWSYFNGGIDFNGTVPITGATGTYNVPIFSYYHLFNFFGRSANVAGALEQPWRSLAANTSPSK
jgi:hypothetical protein